MTFLRPQMCIKSIFGRGSDPDPAGGAYDAPQIPSRMVRGHSSPFPQSPCIRNEVVIRPRMNGFPGPAVALDGPPWLKTNRRVTWPNYNEFQYSSACNVDELSATETKRTCILSCSHVSYFSVYLYTERKLKRLCDCDAVL